MSRRIDLNADVGEIPAALADGREEYLLRLVSSANVACGGHAGTPESMQAVVALCLRLGVAIGAHPSDPDATNFGRGPITMPTARLEAAIRAQVEALDRVVAKAGGTLAHVKPHGALYNEAARDPARALAIAHALEPWRGRSTLVGLAGSVMLEVWQEQGFVVAAEAFADRCYEDDGSLRSRRLAGAVLTDPIAAAAQALGIVAMRSVGTSSGARIGIDAQTLCVHGDTPGAAAIATRIRAELEAHGIVIAPLTAR